MGLTMTKNEQNKLAGMLAQIKTLNGQTLEDWKGFARNALADSGNVTTGEFKSLLEAFVLLIEAIELAKRRVPGAGRISSSGSSRHCSHSGNRWLT
jgi:hypothetical protein